ncbi:transketolase [Solidesulfovibrio carbinolicus]|uniref:Transketolase n=1 Tax=Solidesulfovibrio carbinolicus TaxID=296842 RepID=A0A4P6HQN8_9BACT|nr:transketolase [Solidesulfovibrio carbinolicus]QAZ67558.1 transketolase [Solidesulfovibrio carbinolicus]
MTTASASDAQAVNVIKGLIMDATRKAASGHPGGAMSSADMAYVLFKDYLRYDPADPTWFDRDRFVLSAGHESMLLYALLHLRGLLTMEDLQHFRQFGSKTPGHPENYETPGVECTTGPLGQGFSMSVGMAVAEAMLRERLGEDIAGHYTYVLSSDGDVQTPVFQGSAALAGLWGLGRLIVLFDKNQVQLSGPVAICDHVDYAKLFASMGWHVVEIDGHDHAAIRAAIEAAKAETSRPSMIIGLTTIAKGSATMEGDCGSHGAPFSEDEIKATKKNLGLPEDQKFYLPAEVGEHFRARWPELAAARKAWNTTLEAKLAADAGFEDLWRQAKRAPGNRTFNWPTFDPAKAVATRSAWGKALDAITPDFPLLVGGSADLDPSNQTEKFRKATGVFSPENTLGRTLCFGVREFPMGAIVNGITLHGGLMAFGATFLIFSDYERNALRMAALQRIPALHVFTHDSFYVGEDGPTHEPIEQTSSLRLIPNMLVMRPADAYETCACLEVALTRVNRPTSLLLTRQNLPVLDPAHYPGLQEGTAKGGYVLVEPESGKPDLILMAAGSEVSLAMAAAKLLPELAIRIVSIPCMEIFNEQPEAYKESVLPSAIPFRFAVEAGRPELWCQYTGRMDRIHGISRFGASAPAEKLAEAYGFTPTALAASVKAAWERR